MEAEILKTKLDQLKIAVNKAICELGVPQPGYPQPVANAYEYLTDALKEAEAD